MPVARSRSLVINVLLLFVCISSGSKMFSSFAEESKRTYRLQDAPIFILRLAENRISEQRLSSLREMLPANISEQVRMVNGVNASRYLHIDDMMMDSEVKTLLQSRGHFIEPKLLKGELGCWLGHIKAWSQIASTVEPRSWAIVLEDDAQFTREALQRLSKMEVAYKTAGPHMLFLEDRQCPYGDGSDTFSDLTWGRMLQWRSWVRAFAGHRGYGSQAYAVTPETARLLLKNINMQEPVDILMQRRRLPVEKICPAVLPFVGSHFGESEVHS